ncbi:hypothetical protein SARC_01719 [Sphaeroforma arctica JP610]|uniref:Uncharacterized protein n=1 Tax=Sphaeroforma arctica JP610 TaxID=667725 RepID=A0A0L0GCZ9_9EUKA|nr:hypothetical protein SARC_01719 [Sphaeroforma arctica JP610]KNC86103.1 hypothetical protein SARC_01719 [Sphaeroforma arctica JP610]|eukprot:XP_014160005.1 hypothetical protein SARC_01719 [Sphaeroforma arctica JP610]
MIRGRLQRLVLCLLLASVCICTQVHAQDHAQAQQDANVAQGQDSNANPEKVQEKGQTGMARRLKEIQEARQKALKAERKQAEVRADVSGTDEKEKEKKAYLDARKIEMQVEYLEGIKKREQEMEAAHIEQETRNKEVRMEEGDKNQADKTKTQDDVRVLTPEQIALEQLRESLKMKMKGDTDKREGADGNVDAERGSVVDGTTDRDSAGLDTIMKGTPTRETTDRGRVEGKAGGEDASGNDRRMQDEQRRQQQKENARLLQEQSEQVRQKSGIKLSGRVVVERDRDADKKTQEQQLKEHQRAMDMAKGAQMRAQVKAREIEAVQARKLARMAALAGTSTEHESDVHMPEEIGEMDADEDRMAAGDVGDHLFVKARQYFDEYADDAKVISMMKVASKYGSDAATEFLARQHVFGLLNAPSQGYLPEPDVASALPLLTTLVEEKGYPEAQSLAGFLYGSGVGVDIDIAKSIVYMRFAAETGESYASAALGYRYFRGRNVPQDCAKAMELYLVAATAVAEDLKSGMTKAAEMIRLAQDEDQRNQNGMSQWDILQYYQYMAQRGDIQSALIMGQVLLQGAHGMDQDPGAAADYFNAAAEAGNAEAKAFLASMHHSGVGVESSNLTAFKLYKEAAEEGNAQGQNGLGQMYMLGIVVPQNYEMALKYFTLAAAQGNAEALYNAATMYYSGLGTKVDYKKAFDNFSSSARNGYTLALYHLGIMHNLGFGTSKSCDHAVTYFKNIYDRAGHAHLLAEAYAAFKDGDTSRSLMIYMYIAETGSELAQANAAYILDLLATRHGQLTLHSHPKWISTESVEAYALLQWIKAAEQRSSEAILKKGDHYYFGWGVNASHTTAVECYRTAGTMHNAQALFNIGYMTERGEGVSQDFALAKRYYDQSKEVSQDARVPVYIALAGLRARKLYTDFVQFVKEDNLFKINLNNVEINFENGVLHGINEFYQEVHPATVWGPDWEYHVIFILFIVLITLIHFRRMFYSIEAFETEQARLAAAQAHG